MFRRLELPDGEGVGQAAMTKMARERARLALIVVAFVMPATVAIVEPGVGGLSPWGLRVLAVVVASLLLWISESLPIGVTSIAVVVMLGSLALGTATVRTGLAQRFARLLVRGARGSGDRLYGQMVAMMPAMAIVVPSALTRSAMLIPAYEAIFQSHRIERANLVDRDPQAPAEERGEAQPTRESDDGAREALQEVPNWVLAHE